MAEVEPVGKPFEISVSGTGASRSCSVSLQPARTTGKDLAPRVILTTIGQSSLTLGLEKQSRYTNPTVVQRNVRTPVAIVEKLSTDEFRKSSLAKAIASQRVFFVTAKLADGGGFVSSRFEPIDFDLVLGKMEAGCPFDAESLMANLTARKEIERALSVSAADLTYIRWALNKRYDDVSTKPEPRAALSTKEREFLKRFAVDNRLPVSRFLNKGSVRLLAAGGREAERVQIAVQEEVRYKMSRGNLDAVRAYLAGCQICAFKPQAEKDVAELEKKLAAINERESYNLSRGYMSKLSEYVRTCKICDFESAARKEISELKTQMFEFEVCNSTSYTASVAILHRASPTVAGFVGEGWWRVGGGACKTVGTYPRSRIYASALVLNERRGWFGTDAKQCVEFPGPYTRTSDGSTCESSNRVIGFREFMASGDKVTWTIDREPSTSDDEYFTFEVCNKSSDWAVVATSGRKTPGSSEWTVEGWWRVSPGQCRAIGRYATGAFYAMAEVLNGRGRWGANDLRLCVEHPGPFKRVNSSDFQCSASDLVPFRKFTYGEGRQTWNLLP